MKLTPEQMRDYNVKAAELLGIRIFEHLKDPSDKGGLIVARASSPHFNFFTNAADKDMLVEKLRIYTHPNSFDNYATWNCFSPTFPHAADETDSSMTAAQIKAICACLD